MENNFICDCGEETFIPSYRMIVKVSGNIYKDKSGNELLCKCGKKLKEKQIDKEFGVPLFGKFSSMTSEQKREVLKKRSSEHFQKDLSEKREQMHKDTFNPMLGK